MLTAEGSCPAEEREPKFFSTRYAPGSPNQNNHQSSRDYQPSDTIGQCEFDTPQCDSAFKDEK